MYLEAPHRRDRRHHRDRHLAGHAQRAPERGRVPASDSVDGWRRRRGCDLNIPWRLSTEAGRRGDAAATTWMGVLGGPGEVFGAAAGRVGGPDGGGRRDRPWSGLREVSLPSTEVSFLSFFYLVHPTLRRTSERRVARFGAERRAAFKAENRASFSACLAFWLSIEYASAFCGAMLAMNGSEG